MQAKAENVNLDAVEISSARLILRPVTLAYAEPIFMEFTSEITRYMMPATPKEISETETFIRETTEKRKAGKDLTLVILNRINQEFLGVCGLHGINDSLHPELGIWIKKSAHGNGYGREAIFALYEWASNNINAEYFIYPVDRENVPSRKIPEALHGVIFEEKESKTMAGNILDEVVYKVPAKRNPLI